MRNAGIEQEVILPVLKVVCLPAQLVVEDEVVVRPFQTVSESRRKSVHLELLVIVQDVPHEVGVRLTAIVS